MPHKSLRHALPQTEKLGAFWPVVGVLGLRQVGKTTLLKELMGIGNFVSFDDEDIKEDAQRSAKNFLGKLTIPSIIDEAQKVPPLFDAIKLKVDQKKIPGSYFLTGSSTFSSKLGIRESLTGRIGMLTLCPMTLAEIQQKKFEPKRAAVVHSLPSRFKMEDVMQNLALGGLPVPVFTRDPGQRELYFKNWLETTVIRDVARVYGRGYDPDISWSLLRQFGRILQNGEMPSLRSFKQDSRVLRKYLSAFEDVFLVKKIPCHEEGVGDDTWMISDSGIARHIMGTEFGEGVSLSLGRIFVLNEIHAAFEYSGRGYRPTYYKSARGSPVDWVFTSPTGESGIVKMTTETKGALGYEERALTGAMKKLGLKRGLLAAPVDIQGSISPRSKNGEISLVSWSYWS